VIEITKLTSATGPLTKRISLGANGGLVSDGSACVMGRGRAERVQLQHVGAFADLISNLSPNQAIALGSLQPGLPDQVEVTTARKLGELNGATPPNLIARTSGHISYVPARPALTLLDFDTKGMPDSVRDRVQELGGFWRALVWVMPEIEHCAKVVRRSTSSGITRSDTDQEMKGSDGIHIFVLVQDGADIERFLRTLHDRCWLAGLGWMMVGAGGQLLERSIVDRMVYAAERLVFEGAPILLGPLAQDVQRRTPTVSDGEAADTATAYRSLTIVETARLSKAKAAERYRLSAPAAEAHVTFVKEHAARIAARFGSSPAKAARTVEQLCEGILLPDVELPFDDAEMSAATVRDVLADPDRFVGATLADPLESIAYGRCKAMIMRRPDGSLWINSFAHGRTTYDLKYDGAAVAKVVLAADPVEAADTFVKMLPLADLTADEDQRLRELAAKRAGIATRPMGTKIKHARAKHAQQRAAAEQDRAAATRTDRRLQLYAPAPDAERLPVLDALDEVLCAVDEPEPPMRNLDGLPIQVRTRPPMMLHELSPAGANQNEAPTTRLPPPELPLLTKLMTSRCDVA